MTKDERINLLKQIEKDIDVCSLDATFEEMAKSRAIRSAIKELEKRRWIPVTERLPEKGGLYFVTKENDYGSCVATEWFYQNNWSTGWKVLAWMPLPKPYKEGAEE